LTRKPGISFRDKLKTTAKGVFVMASFLKKVTFAAIIAVILMTSVAGCSAPAGSKKTENRAGTPEEDLEFTIMPVLPVNNDIGTGNLLPEPGQTEEQAEENVPADEDGKVAYYLEKLKDRSFVATYGDNEEPKVWYTAAEELGMIGKKSIPGLIEKLSTDDDYERALALYALLLASQDEEVKAFTNGEYIDVTLDFNPESHKEMAEKALAWWDKYKDNF